MSSEMHLRNILEAALLAAGRPLSLDRLLALFAESEQPDRAAVRDALADLSADYAGRGIEVSEVASGWRIQVTARFAPWVSRLWDEKPQRYSRALMETLALIAYRQPITRGEIEEVRGVTVSTNIVKTLLEREWVRVVGHRDVPGRPALYATTREFLDYFGLRGLDELPTLDEIKDLESLNRQFEFAEAPEAGVVEGPPDSPRAETGTETPAGAGGDAGSIEASTDGEVDATPSGEEDAAAPPESHVAH